MAGGETKKHCRKTGHRALANGLLFFADYRNMDLII
jgi:hypothetical protein